MKSMRMNIYGVVALLILAMGCGGTTVDVSDNGLTFISAADFSATAAASLAKGVAKTTTGVCADLPDLDSDDPSLTDGLDCDSDGGVVAHVTPTQYSIAFKKLVLSGSGATADVNIIADTGTLADAQVVSFTSSDASETLLDLAQEDLVPGTYSGVEMEIYYVQMTFPVAGVDQHVRIYMSDDDFAAEGSLGHHQGDITFINSSGTELGWIDSTWTTAGLTTTRSDDQNGAGGVDAETGHARGFFGDTTLWNATDFVQGDSQDIYTASVDFSSALEVPATPLFQMNVTLTFSVADTFYYEDFAPQNTDDFPGFYPDTGGEATAETAEWAPIFPAVALSLAVE